MRLWSHQVFIENRYIYIYQLFDKIPILLYIDREYLLIVIQSSDSNQAVLH